MNGKCYDCIGGCSVKQDILNQAAHFKEAEARVAEVESVGVLGVSFCSPVLPATNLIQLLDGTRRTVGAESTSVLHQPHQERSLVPNVANAPVPDYFLSTYLLVSSRLPPVPSFLSSLCM
ncbi:hypothetical protein ILYODFUR_029390 [Ilyodon furcidens]|uniref:Uncharacterized protein n=1 Tax=Ilyodon furcidens TaxID=33524 RepID=A0ABV0V7T4_9TELE